MFILRRFHGDHFERVNTIIESLYGHLTGHVNLIGSATLPFPEVCAAHAIPGSACRVEGHLGERYFPATLPLDQAESLAEDGARRMFSLDKSYLVSAQLHSATQSNQAVWRALLDTGDVVLGLSLTDGGHISHVLGLPNGVSFLPFPITSTGIDYNALENLAVAEKPKLIVAGGSSYPLKIDFAKLKKIADCVGAFVHVDMAHIAPLVASGLHPPATPFADTITIDTGKGLRGPKGGVLLFKQQFKKEIRRAIFPLGQSSPNQSAIIAKACMFEIWNKTDLKVYAENLVNAAEVLANTLIQNGLSLVFGKTESHLLLIDLRKIGLLGKEAERQLEECKILTNRNAIPDDDAPPWIGSGLRLSTTTLAILNYREEDIALLGEVVAYILTGRDVKADAVKYLLERYHAPLASIASE